ncbi:MAG TPA: hypothetical protein O0Y17_04755, partial [Methanocorpusculum sp.]|nr:hypothetical protein [Methanocorpusculum sp.]
FLHTVGMSEDQIEGIFSRSPNYNADMTEYQVNHILTHEYDSMSCATMQTHGVCSHKSAQCTKINHPLNYYRNAKKLAERKRLAEERKAANEAAAAAAKAKTEAGKEKPDSAGMQNSESAEEKK